MKTDAEGRAKDKEPIAQHLHSRLAVPVVSHLGGVRKILRHCKEFNGIEPICME